MKYIAVHDRKITQQELAEAFGEKMPIEVADILVAPMEAWETLISTRLKINELIRTLISPNDMVHS